MSTYISQSTAPDLKGKVRKWQRIEAAATVVVALYRTKELDVPELKQAIDDLEWAVRTRWQS